MIINADDIDFDKYLEGPNELSHILTPSAISADVKRRFDEVSEGYGYTLPFAATHEFVRVRPGEVSIWGGINGHGKSLVLSQIILWLMRHSARICLASMEMRPVDTMHRMVQQAGCSPRPDDAYIDAFGSWCDDKLFLYDQQGSVATDRLFALMRYAQQELKCDQMVIDSMMKCGIGTADYDGQKEFIARLCSHAMSTGMHIHLVAHSRKTEDEHARMNKMDIKGTSEITDQVDNLYTIWRNKKKEDLVRKGTATPEDLMRPDAVISNDKQRHGRPGNEGSYGLWLDTRAISFVDKYHGHAQPLQLDMKDGTVGEPSAYVVPF